MSFTLVNKGRKPQRVMVDLVVHFVKARGTGAKTFKLKALELAPRARVEIAKKIGLKQLTTRKHYPGVHKVEALLNGQRGGARLVSRCCAEASGSARIAIGAASASAAASCAYAAAVPLIERALHPALRGGRWPVALPSVSKT